MAASPFFYNQSLHKGWPIVFLAALSLAGASRLVAQETPEPSAPQAASREVGTIAGRIFDAATGQPISAALILVENRIESGMSGLDGRYSIAGLPVGPQNLLINKAGYRQSRLTEIAVAAGGVTQADFPLPPLTQAAPTEASGDVIEMETFSVQASVVQGSNVALQMARRESVAAIDFMSSADMGKYSTTDVSDVISRVPGISVTDTKFAVIRGLGDRYTNTQLEGVVQPSPDPDRQAVQLDLFPTKLIDNIKAQKTFTPDQPGDSSGGSLNLEINKFPDTRSISLTVGAKVNDAAMKTDFYPTYETDGNAQLWAMGKNDRDEPTDQNAVPMFIKNGNAPIGYKLALSYGDTYKVFKTQKLGVIFGFSYDSSAKYITGTQQNRITDSANPGSFLKDNPLPTYETGFEIQQSKEEVLWGSMGGLAYQFSPDHQVSANYFVTQNGIDDTRRRTSFYRSDDAEYFFGTDYPWFEIREPNRYLVLQDLYYRERDLTVYQLKGEHNFESAGDLKANWSLNWTRTGQEEPDARTSFYYIDVEEDGRENYTVGSIGPSVRSFERGWRSVQDKQFNYSFDLAKPFTFWGEEGALAKTGFSKLEGDRIFNDFYTIWPSGLGTVDVTFDEMVAWYDQVFTKGGYPYTTPIAPANAKSGRVIQAGYLMLNLPLNKKVKISGGVRMERTELTATGNNVGFGNISLRDTLKNPFIREAMGRRTDSLTGSLVSEDALPALTLNWEMRKNMNLRLATSVTVARPSYREFGPYITVDFDTDDLVVGNNELQMSTVRNLDLRWEWFFAKSDLLAVSGFYKEIEKPIEQIKDRFGAFPKQMRTWVNNPDNAQLAGVEIEVRKGLQFISERLSDFSVGANYSYIRAEVGLLPTEARKLRAGYPLNYQGVPTKRRLFDQPEWLMNFDLSYKNRWGTEVTLAVNSTSDTLFAVAGSNSLDLYKDSFTRLDLTIGQKIAAGWKVKFAATNLTNPERRLIYDPSIASDPQIVYRSIKEGRGYSLSVSYDY